MNIPITTPHGILKVNGILSHEQAERIKQQWMDAFSGPNARGVVVLERGIEFQPFTVPTIPLAICRYCTSPNLNSSLWCSQCGAALVTE